MLKSFTFGAIAGALLLVATSAGAQDSRFYLHGSLGQASIEETGFVRYEDDSDTAIGVRFGWRGRPWLGVELGYSDFGSFDTACPGGGSTCSPITFPDRDFTTTELGLNFRLPFGDSGFYGTGRAGVHDWDAGSGDGATDTYYGVGVGYKFAERFGVSLDYDRYDTDNAILDIDRTSVGVEVNF